MVKILTECYETTMKEFTDNSKSRKKAREELEIKSTEFKRYLGLKDAPPNKMTGDEESFRTKNIKLNFLKFFVSY